MNSAVHSYLILAYTDNDKVAMNVGFYYRPGVVRLEAGASTCVPDGHNGCRVAAPYLEHRLYGCHPRPVNAYPPERRERRAHVVLPSHSTYAPLAR